MSGVSIDRVGASGYVMWQPLHKHPTSFLRLTGAKRNRSDFDPNETKKNRHCGIEDNDDDDDDDEPLFPWVFGTEAKSTKEMGESIMIGNSPKNTMKIGHSSLQGFRVSNEDAHLCKSIPELSNTHAFLAVFDGHAGKGTSKFASEHMMTVFRETDGFKKYLASKLTSANTTMPTDGTSIPVTVADDTDIEIKMIELAFKQAMVAMDDAILADQRKKKNDISGSTSVCTFVSSSHIISGWVGDSRCMVGKANGECVSLSEDHKPEDIRERKRIYAAGGFVMDNRVDGQLAMSRALGDFHFKGNESIARSKQKVSCIPEVQVHKRDPTDRLLLICCDGVFDVMSNEAAVTNVLERYEEYKKDSMSKNVPNIAEKLAEDLIDDALEKGSYDNISAIVCLLPGSVAPFPTDSD